MSDYFLLINKEKTGPYSASDIKTMLQRQAIGDEAFFWTEPMSDWQPIGLNRHLFGVSSQVSDSRVSASISYPQMPAVVMQPVMIFVPKSRVAFVLLGLFLGGLGIHNFYAGYTGKAVTQLLLNLFLFWTIIVPFGIAIWALIEVIAIDRDANGVRFN